MARFSPIPTKKRSACCLLLLTAHSRVPDSGNVSERICDVHLRLATLHNTGGIKDKAAFEYEEFLKKRRGYADRKKLEPYIADTEKIFRVFAGQ